MNECICSAGGILPWNDHSEYCPIFMKSYIIKLETIKSIATLLCNKYYQNTSDICTEMTLLYETLKEQS